MVREAGQRDLDAILELYLFLHEDSIPKKDEHLGQRGRFSMAHFFNTISTNYLIK